MKDTIIQVLANITNQMPDTINEDTVIQEIPGFDSLQYVMMISELQESYDIEIPLDKAIEVQTVGELISSANRIN